jgi:hypothetical protein
MAIYSGATYRPISWAKRSRNGTKPTAVVCHVTASNATSQYGYFSGGTACSHFHVAKDGRVEQYIDTQYRSAADLDGNYRTISIETQGLDDGTGWTTAQLGAIAGIVAWAHDVHGIPLRLMDSSKTSEHGLGWHRLGIDGNFPALPSILAGRRQRGGGEYWTKATGKACPCDPRIKQMPDVLDRATANNTTEGDWFDMATKKDLEAAVLDVLKSADGRKAIANAAWNTDGVISAPSDTDTKSNPYWTGRGWLGSIRTAANKAAS